MPKPRRNVVATHFVFRETGDRQRCSPVPVCSEKPSQNNLECSITLAARRAINSSRGLLDRRIAPAVIFFPIPLPHPPARLNQPDPCAIPAGYSGEFDPTFSQSTTLFSVRGSINLRIPQRAAKRVFAAKAVRITQIHAARHAEESDSIGSSSPPELAFTRPP